MTDYSNMSREEIKDTLDRDALLQMGFIAEHDNEEAHLLEDKGMEITLMWLSHNASTREDREIATAALTMRSADYDRWYA